MWNTSGEKEATLVPLRISSTVQSFRHWRRKATLELKTKIASHAVIHWDKVLQTKIGSLEMAASGKSA